MLNILAQAAGGITIDALTGFAVVGSLAGTIAFMFKLLMSAKDAQIAAVIAEKDKTAADKDSYRAIVEDMVNHWLVKRGQEPLPTVPLTKPEEEVKQLQTIRAAVSQIKVENAKDAQSDGGVG